jgi:hypothetical protein
MTSVAIGTYSRGVKMATFFGLFFYVLVLLATTHLD